MIRRICVTLLVLVAAGTMLTGCSRQQGGASDKLVVSGSTTILPIAEIAAEEFKASRPGIEVLPSGMGSSVGIESVASGRADIGTSSRDLKPEEEGLGLVDTPIAYDGIAVIVNPANTVKGLTTEQLRGIFSGRITNWKDVGGPDLAIQLVNRDEASGTREAFKKIVMGDERFDKHAAVLSGTGSVREVVSSSPGAVGYISLGFVEPRFTSTRVKPLPIDGVAPTEQTVASGKYPISRALHFFTKGEPTGLAQEFTDFVLSDAVQKTVVIDAGFVPVADKDN